MEVHVSDISSDTCVECGQLSDHPNTNHLVEIEFERGTVVTFTLCVLHCGWFTGRLSNVMFDKFRRSTPN